MERKTRAWTKVFTAVTKAGTKTHEKRAAEALAEEYDLYLDGVARAVAHEKFKAMHLLQALEESLKPDLFTPPHVVKLRALSMIEKVVRFDSTGADDMQLIVEVSAKINEQIAEIKRKKEEAAKKLEEDKKKLEEKLKNKGGRAAKLVALRRTMQVPEDSDDEDFEEEEEVEVVFLPLHEQLGMFIEEIKHIVAGLLCRFIEGRAEVDKVSPLKRYVDLKARFNEFKRPFGEGRPKIRVLAINGDQFGEGVSLLGVDRLVMVNPSRSYTEYQQLIGRVLRACASHPQKHFDNPVVKLDQYIATIDPAQTEKLLKARTGKAQPAPSATADEIFLRNLENQKAIVDKFMTQEVEAVAVDRGMYVARKPRKAVVVNAYEARPFRRFPATAPAKSRNGFAVPSDGDFKLTDRPWLSADVVMNKEEKGQEENPLAQIADAGVKCMAVMKPAVERSARKAEQLARKRELAQRRKQFFASQPGDDAEKKRKWSGIVNKEASQRRKEEQAAKKRGEILKKQVLKARAYAATEDVERLTRRLSSVRAQLVERQNRIERVQGSDAAGLAAVRTIQVNVRQGGRRR
jgi:hypothetical protein